MGKIEELIDEKIKYWERQDEKSSCYHKEAGLFINIALSDMRKLKSSLPTQQDKVVVPKVTGVMIDYFKREGFSLHESLNVHVNVPNIFSLVYKEFREWLTADDYATKEDIFARAWLDGYTVEKEQLYYVEIPLPNKVNGCGRLGQSRSGGLEVLYTKISLEPKWKTQFTENEIKAIDERYWAFAVPVEEEAE